MSSDGPGALAAAGSEPGPGTTAWERQIGQAAVALCEAVLEREASGEFAVAPETAGIIEAALRAVVHDEVQRGDFLDQALALAEDIVAQNPRGDRLAPSAWGSDCLPQPRDMAARLDWATRPVLPCA